MKNTIRKHIAFHGRVQGVGFRVVAVFPLRSALALLIQTLVAYLFAVWHNEAEKQGSDEVEYDFRRTGNIDHGVSSMRLYRQCRSISGQSDN